MKMKREPRRRARRAFRLEWEGDGGRGRVYLFGVRSIGEYADRCKRFMTSAGWVSVFGNRLTLSTYRSGCVVISGEILGVSVDGKPKEENRIADD